MSSDNRRSHPFVTILRPAVQSPNSEHELIEADHGALTLTPTEGVATLRDVPTAVWYARWFTREHGEHLRFDHHQDAWFYYQAPMWHQDRDGHVWRLAMDLSDRMMHEALAIEDDNVRPAAVRFAQGCASVPGVHSVMTIAKNLPPITCAQGEWDPDPLSLGTPNGIIDLRTGELRDGDPSDMIRLSVLPPFDPEARCPTFKTFIVDMFDDDRDLIHYAHKALGYSLTGLMGEQCLWMLHGDGANGKSTLLQVIAHVLGTYAWAAPASTFDAGHQSSIPNDLASLNGKRFVIGLSEAGAHGGTKLNEARIKQVSGGDTMTARHLYQEYSEYQPTSKLWLAFNHRPRVQDDSPGMWRKLRLIKLHRTFPLDDTLKDRLKTEAQGILAWCVEGCLLYQQEGLESPLSVVAETKDYKRDSDPLGDFVEDCCEPAPKDSVSGQEFYIAYITWCERRRISPRERITATEFGERLKLRYSWKRRSGGVRYEGVRLIVPGPV